MSRNTPVGFLTGNTRCIVQVLRRTKSSLELFTRWSLQILQGIDAGRHNDSITTSKISEVTWIRVVMAERVWKIAVRNFPALSPSELMEAPWSRPNGCGRLGEQSAESFGFLIAWMISIRFLICFRSNGPANGVSPAELVPQVCLQ
jgi:hypothetical protein